ncbi:MAG: hypothetical protein ABSG15_03480 [FCB group bacterium]|jgi:hypothetical protein
MIKKIFFFSAMTLMILISCSNEKENKERFMNTYREILIAREREQDSSKTNSEVKKIYQKNNYNEASFFEDWKKYSSNPQEFLIMMDTIRDRAQKEILRLDKK